MPNRTRLPRPSDGRQAASHRPFGEKRGGAKGHLRARRLRADLWSIGGACGPTPFNAHQPMGANLSSPFSLPPRFLAVPRDSALHPAPLAAGGIVVVVPPTPPTWHRLSCSVPTCSSTRAATYITNTNTNALGSYSLPFVVSLIPAHLYRIYILYNHTS